MNYFVLVTVLCVLFFQSSHELKYKCGMATEKCQILSNGKVFWPKDFNKTCPLAPLCSPDYRLHKVRLGNLRACCCRYKTIEICPDCVMKTRDFNFSEWIDFHLSKNFTGPPEGKCSNGKVKRIFIPNEKGKADKCCCEPRTSPYIFASET